MATQVEVGFPRTPSKFLKNGPSDLAVTIANVDQNPQWVSRQLSALVSTSADFVWIDKQLEAYFAGRLSNFLGHKRYPPQVVGEVYFLYLAIVGLEHDDQSPRWLECRAVFLPLSLLGYSQSVVIGRNYLQHLSMMYEGPTSSVTLFV